MRFKIALLVVCSVATFLTYSLIQNSDSQQEVLPQEFFDRKPTSEHVSYIYAPGMMGTEMLMGRYCPSYTASTGEKITWKSGGHVIGYPHTGVIFAEIDLHKPTKRTMNPIKAYVNQLRCDLFPFIQRMFQDAFEFTVEDNPNSDKSVVSYSFDFGKANLGQKKDIEAYCRTYQNHIKKFPNTNIVLFGDSRGAASTFNFIATHKPKQVKAAIMDSVFDSVPHCIKHFIYEDKEKRTEERLHDIINFSMGSYRKKGPFPRDYAETITDDIPLLFVTSLKDGLVAPQCTMYLYKRLKERGFKKIHLLVLKKSLHPCYMIGDPEDKKMYEAVVHAFYKHYGLPHNSQKAMQGQDAFIATQPTIEELNKTYQLPACKFCN